MSSENPYSAPLGQQQNPNVLTTHTNSGFVIAICVVYLVFGISNLTCMPCTISFFFYLPEWMDFAAEQDPAFSEENAEVMEQMELLKKFRNPTNFYVMISCGLLLGLFQLVVGIAGFKRSQFAKSSIPVVAVFALIVIGVSVVLGMLEPSPEDMGLDEETLKQIQAQQGVSMIVPIVTTVLFVGFYISVLVFSFSERYRAHFGEDQNTMMYRS
jgi:amino acid transporter